MRLYDRKVDKIMIRDLINITQEEINVSAAKSTEGGPSIMHLQNNGRGAHRLNSDDMDVWINEDIDE